MDRSNLSVKLIKTVIPDICVTGFFPSLMCPNFSKCFWIFQTQRMWYFAFKVMFSLSLCSWTVQMKVLAFPEPQLMDCGRTTNLFLKPPFYLKPTVVFTASRRRIGLDVCFDFVIIMFLFWVLMKLKLFIHHTLAGWVCLLECPFLKVVFIGFPNFFSTCF